MTSRIIRVTCNLATMAGTEKDSRQKYQIYDNTKTGKIAEREVKSRIMEMRGN